MSDLNRLRSAQVIVKMSEPPLCQTISGVGFPWTKGNEKASSKTLACLFADTFGVKTSQVQIELKLGVTLIAIIRLEEGRTLGAFDPQVATSIAKAVRSISDFDGARDKGVEFVVSPPVEMKVRQPRRSAKRRQWRREAEMPSTSNPEQPSGASRDGTAAEQFE